MSFFDAVRSYYNNGLNFSGRASVSEYWWIVLYELILFSVLFYLYIEISYYIYYMFSSAGFLMFSLIILLILVYHLIASLSLSVRRLHDTNKPGIYALVALIPYIGWLILAYFMIIPSSPKNNIYGKSLKITSPLFNFDTIYSNFKNHPNTIAKSSLTKPKVSYCPQCGHENTSAGIFCISCGVKILNTPE